MVEGNRIYDVNRMIDVKHLLGDEYVFNIQKSSVKYVILFDSTTGKDLNNMVKAINVMSQNGWRCINITSSGGGGRIVMYALMEKLETIM